MKASMAFFAGCLVLAAAIVAASFSPVYSQQRRADGFMIASDGTQFVWRVNTTTGEISYCFRRDNSTDEKLIGNRAPICSAASPAVGGY